MSFDTHSLSAGPDLPHTVRNVPGHNSDRALSSSKLAVSDALTELCAAGLVHTHAELVLLTRAAQHMDRLSL